MPEPGRTITLLSAFCNYFAHCQAQSDAVQQVRDEAYTARDTLVKAAKKAAEAEQAVAKLRAEHAREHAQQAALQAEVRSVEAKVVEKGAERAEGEKELKEAKERKEALVKEKVRPEDAFGGIQADCASSVGDPDGTTESPTGADSHHEESDRAESRPNSAQHLTTNGEHGEHAQGARCDRREDPGPAGEATAVRDDRAGER
jgi:chromosome segregation ATPase